MTRVQTASTLSRLTLPVSGGGAAPLASVRADAERFVGRRGFPTTRDEDWRYTDLGPLLSLDFALPSEADLSSAALDELAASVGDLGGLRLVFVNGRLDAARSCVRNVPDGVLLTSLAERAEADPSSTAAHLSLLSDDHHAFSALNAALATDGAFIEIARGVTVTEPIELVFLALPEDAPVVISPRSLLLLGPMSTATVVERFAGAPGVVLDNGFVEIRLDDDAALTHVKVQEESESAFHLATLHVTQARDSSFYSSLFSLGATLSREEIQVNLVGPGASTELNGLFMGHGNQQHDNPTTIEHAAGHCQSRQLYKGVIDDRAHGIFNGRVIVHPDAGGTDASQLNKNLLLSEWAEVDTRPRLEILADDVKVSHGAAVGQLDHEALFYLRSRGIPEPAARDLLVAGFVREMLELLPPLGGLRAEVGTSVDRHLPSSSVVEQ